MPQVTRQLSGARLFAERSRRLMTQEEFGELVGIAHNTISWLETGNRSVKGKTLRQIAQALQLEPEALTVDGGQAELVTEEE